MSKARQLADLGNQVDDGAITGSNMVINGAMTVAQRSSSVTGVTSNGYYTCDRFKIQVGNIGTYTVDQSTDAPNGFSNSWKISCTTADASPAAGDYLLLNHFIEGQDLQSLGFGTSGAKALTMSFWVKSNKAGNASFEVEQSDNSAKMVGFQYTINATDTWEYKTISIPADTAGVINNDNGKGFQINWWLNSGSTFTSGSHNSTWTAFSAGDTNPSNLGIGGSTSDYWQITGVCLNVGDSAIDFPHDESYGETLAKCKRYFERIGTPAGSSYQSFGVGHVHTNVTAVSVIPYEVEKRANPTASYDTASNFALLNAAGGAVACTGRSTSRISTYAVSITANASGLVVGNATFLLANNTAKPFIDIEAEL